MKNIVECNAYPFRMNSKEVIDGAFIEYMNNPPSGSEWHDFGKDDNEDNEIVDENADKEMRKDKENANEEKNDYESPLSLKYKAEALKDTMSAEEYCLMMRNLK